MIGWYNIIFAGVVSALEIGAWSSKLDIYISLSCQTDAQSDLDLKSSEHPVFTSSCFA